MDVHIFLSEELEKLRTKKAVDNKKKMLRVSYTGEVRFFYYHWPVVMLRILKVIKKNYFRQKFYYHVNFDFFITVGFL